MSVVKVRIQKDFTVLYNGVLENPDLSFKAKGLWAYCMSKPDNWQFHVTHLATVSKDGIDAVYSALSELEAAGLVEKSQPNENGVFGKMDYIIYPYTQQIKIMLPLRDFPLPVNPALVSTNTKQISNPPLIPKGVPLNGRKRDFQNPRNLRDSETKKEEEDFEKFISSEEEEYVSLKLRERKPTAEKIANYRAWKAVVLKNYREEREKEREARAIVTEHQDQALEHDGRRINGDLVSVCRDRVEFTSGSFFKAVPFAASREVWKEQTSRWFGERL